MGGRAFEISFYEWRYYTQHPSNILSYWRGGMATYGILLRGVVAIWLFSRMRGKSFLAIADEMAIPGAFLMGVGRIGNFIDGQILGAVTDGWWAVKFPCAEGFRHPVTLYDSLKNFLMIPLLLAVRRASPPVRGMLLAHFVFWYGFGRFFADLFREYPTTFFGVGTGQYFNILMAMSGLILMSCFTFMNRWLRCFAPKGGRLASRPAGRCVEMGPWELRPTVWPVTSWPKQFLFILLVPFPLIIPTDWHREM